MASAGAVSKKKSLKAAEQDRPDVAAKRQSFQIARRFIDPQQLVFLDESGAKTNMTTLYGRSPVGQRCVDATAHGHWQTTTILSAIRLSGVIGDATMLFDGPMDAATFLGYTQQCLAPSLHPGDVVMMDNLASHKAEGVAAAIESVGASVWYLPAYSPDLNPIEKLWSKVKAWLRRTAARTFDELVKATADALRHVDVDECRNYFLSCGYCQ